MVAVPLSRSQEFPMRASNHFLEPNRLAASALAAEPRFGRVVHARVSISAGGRSGKRLNANATSWPSPPSKY